MASSISLSIDSDLDSVALIARAVRAICADRLESGSLDGVELSVVEALNNVIEHGYHGERGRQVRVTLRLQADRVVVEILDEAPPMDSDLLDQAGGDVFAFDVDNLDALPEGGMGLALIRVNMDEVDYNSANGTNCLRMVKRLAPA